MESHTFTICRDDYCNSVYFHVVLLTLRKLPWNSQHWRPAGQATSSQCPKSSAGHMPNIESAEVFFLPSDSDTGLIRVMSGMAGVSSPSPVTAANHCRNALSLKSAGQESAHVQEIQLVQQLAAHICDIQKILGCLSLSAFSEDNASFSHFDSQW